MDQAKNRQILRQVIKAKIAKNEPPCVLNLWIQPCGTYGCVLGDYMLQKSPGMLEMMGMSDFEELCFRFDFEGHFGFDAESNYVDVMGDESTGTLQQRLDYVESQILRLDGEEALK